MTLTPADRALAELFAGAVPFDPVPRGPGVSAPEKAQVLAPAADTPAPTDEEAT